MNNEISTNYHTEKEKCGEVNGADRILFVEDNGKQYFVLEKGVIHEKDDMVNT